MHLKINLSSSFDSLLEVFVCGVHAAHQSYVWFRVVAHSVLLSQKDHQTRSSG
jgi:hypothetical protein